MVQVLLNKTIVFVLIGLVVLSCFTVVVVEAASIPQSDNGFMESLSTGFKFATRLLGMNQSSSVANLVAQAFAAPSPQQNSSPKIANKHSQNYQYQEDSEYSSNDKDNFVVSSDKADNLAPQFSNPAVEENYLSGGASGPGASTTTTSAPASSFSGIAGLLRVLGMDEKKLSALMVNGLIFIAQMIQKIIMSTGNSANSASPSGVGPEGKEGRNVNSDGAAAAATGFDLWDLIVNSQSNELKTLLTTAQHSDLPDKLASFVADQEMETGESACIQLLICKTSPILRKMQNSITGRISGKEWRTVTEGNEYNVQDTFMGQMPSVKELQEYGHECEKKYPACDLDTVE